MMRTLRCRLVRSTVLALCSTVAVPFSASQTPPTVEVSSAGVGPRTMEAQTRSSVIRDYLLAWQDFGKAFEENRADLLASSFVGTAKEKLAETIQQQQEAGIRTRYRASRHQIDLAFYSPEGMSIELIDTVDYDVGIIGRGGLDRRERLRSRYVAVLTPTEVRWKVRIWQAAPK